MIEAGRGRRGSSGSEWRRLWLGIGLLATVTLVGTIGYVVLGFGALDALYQTVTTVTTVGFREVEPLGRSGQIFTIVLILAGVGTALYTLTVLLELLVEGHLGWAIERRKMDKRIAALRGHVIVCGWGRVGRAIARELSAAGKGLVVVDNDAERIATIGSHLYVHGDASDDDVLMKAGIERADALIAAVSTDPANLFITLSGRSLQPDLFIVSRAREENSQPKLERAGANRVVNPQEIGGARIAAFVLRPHVTEFLDVVMHEREIELRLEELHIEERSPLAGLSLAGAKVRERTGALILALRDEQHNFITNPTPDTVIQPGRVLIAIGTPTQLASLARVIHDGFADVGDTA
ncbi:MAG: TrkA family potassium uptake protein [Jiangellaceae bacterium]